MWGRGSCRRVSYYVIYKEIMQICVGCQKRFTQNARVISGPKLKNKISPRVNLHGSERFQNGTGRANNRWLFPCEYGLQVLLEAMVILNLCARHNQKLIWNSFMYTQLKAECCQREDTPNLHIIIIFSYT